MELKTDNKFKDTCPVCILTEAKNWLSLIDGINIDQCESCGVGYVNPYLNIDNNYYDDYGDYITKLPQNYFTRRLRLTLSKSVFFSVVSFFLGKSIHILDYGGGAGFFLNSAKLKGFYNLKLYEPSINFRRAAVEKVGLHEDQIIQSMADNSEKYDFVSMLDVIEHLPQKDLANIISELCSHMHEGSYIFGETPNKKSLNITLFKEKDPVVCPPSHVLYFTTKSLDHLLCKHGFKKVLLVTKGLSTNSFFRQSKFKPSFVEMPKTKMQRALSIAIKLIFAILSLPLSLFGFGYQIIFLYRYESVINAQNDKKVSLNDET